MRDRRYLAIALLATAASSALASTDAVPAKTPTRTSKSVSPSAGHTTATPTPSPAPAPADPAVSATATATKQRRDGAHARVTFGQAGILRTAREVVGRREEPLTPEEDTAKQIEKLLRGPLRYGVTGLFVADAKSGEPLFAVNADEALNPASNVKMISTATALELLGPDFRYPTRVLGPEPDDKGAVHGNVYLLGSWDPTLANGDLDEIAGKLAARGIRELDGNVVVGGDATRDGVFRDAVIPVTVHAAAAGQPPTATTTGDDLFVWKVTATTAPSEKRAQLALTTRAADDGQHHARVEVTVAGTIGKGGTATIPVAIAQHNAIAAHALRAALRAHAIEVHGDIASEELGDFVGDATLAGALPVELARHESATLAEIISNVNKWSINWLADRVIMTAAALAANKTPSMQLAVDAMYGWLEHHVHVGKDDVVVDTGSGLSYHTKITPHVLVQVVRSAAGFSEVGDSSQAHAWLDSLSVAGMDGTLGRRFRTPDVRGRMHGKTGTLSTVIALSGVIDVDPSRPLAFSIVTNGDRPLSKAYVRKAHEQLVALITKYVQKTAKALPAPLPPVETTPATKLTAPDDLEDLETDSMLDQETAGSAMHSP
jgi:serine-type D-Ala-D-Ala carboxypeptidase/endopeptidase (penicillin-binding protein 4)